MQVDVAFKQMEHSEALSRYAQEKLDKVLKHLAEPVNAQVVLQVEKYRHIAKVTVSANGVVIKGKEETNDMYSSLDLVTDKLERQVKKYHGKLVQKHGSRGPGREYRAQVKVISETTTGREGPEIIRTKEIILKPMTVDEAVMQMELLNKNFLLFNNAGTHRLSVIFFRDDGHLGLIEPQVEE